MKKRFIELILPLSVMLPRVKVKDRKYILNLNTYRNTHHFTLNEAKASFSALVKKQLAGMDRDTPTTLNPPIFLGITIFPARKCDLANVQAIVEKFVADSIVESGMLTDDNCEVITGGGYEFGGYDKINPRAVVRISER